MADLPPRLADLLRKTQALIGQSRSHFDGGTVYTIEELIRSAMSLEEDREKRVQQSFLLTEFRDFYRAMVQPKSAADAQVLVEETPAAAFLTLVPSHPGGRSAGIAEIRRAIQLAGVTHGLNFAAIEAAAEKFSRKEETIHSVQIAQGEPAGQGEDGGIEYACRVFDKERLFAEETGESDLAVENVAAGQLLARIRPPTAGRPGRGVRGQELPGIRGREVELRPGAGVQRTPGELRAVISGAVVRDGPDVDVVPFYVVTGDLHFGQDVGFAGNVLVTGHVLGPVTIRAEDVFIAGSAEEAEIHARGDVWIGGAFAGKRRGVIESEGRVRARAISDAAVTALGDVVARNSITYSDVTSNDRVLVTEERGSVVGGQIAALREIVARTIGSDFGTETTTTVGCDFLSPKRLEKIELRIREHEQNLAKIDLLKRKFAEARVDVTKLPPDKQDLYIAVLQKEQKAREEMAGLRRAQEKFAQSVRRFLQATIRVLDQLHPPVKVRIGEAVREIQERLERVTLALDRENHILVRKEE